jgi:hypothetical protein
MATMDTATEEPFFFVRSVPRRHKRDSEVSEVKSVELDWWVTELVSQRTAEVQSLWAVAVTS